MTPEQYARYTAAMITGYTSGVGGSEWVCYRPSAADGVNSAPTLTSAGTRTGYVVRERLVVYGQSFPGQPVGATQWRLNAPIDTDVLPGDVLVSGSYAFLIGILESDQGFPTGIVTVTDVPQTTYGAFRSPLWLLGIGAT